MVSFRIERDAGHEHVISVRDVTEATPEIVKTLVDIDLQTFSESTFSYYTAAALVRSGRVFLLEADGLVIGTCVCVRAWERSTEALLLSMGIRPGYRGKGLGHWFLGEVTDRLRAKGLVSVTLMVSEDNRRAIRVYEDSGFERTGEHAEDPRTGERLMVLRRRLQEPALAEIPIR